MATKGSVPFTPFTPLPDASPLDETYTWAAIRYVERNPVKASMVKRAEDYAWSSKAL